MEGTEYTIAAQFTSMAQAAEVFERVKQVTRVPGCRLTTRLCVGAKPIGTKAKERYFVVVSGPTPEPALERAIASTLSQGKPVDTRDRLILD